MFKSLSSALELDLGTRLRDAVQLSSLGMTPGGVRDQTLRPLETHEAVVAKVSGFRAAPGSFTSTPVLLREDTSQVLYESIVHD